MNTEILNVTEDLVLVFGGFGFGFGGFGFCFGGLG